jgi:coenzyme PQQ precursor peptide PqqA
LPQWSRAASEYVRAAAIAILAKRLTWVAFLESRETLMSWTTPTLVEICIGLEINGYLPAEF